MSTLDYDRARAFIEAIPTGRWACYGDVATVAGNPDAAQAIGNWLRLEGHLIARYWRVLRSDSFVAYGFVAHAAGPPHDAATPSGCSGNDRLDRPPYIGHLNR
jgi:hypothetical protein